jgi:hypothetical protein
MTEIKETFTTYTNAPNKKNLYSIHFICLAGFETIKQNGVDTSSYFSCFVFSDVFIMILLYCDYF